MSSGIAWRRSTAPAEHISVGHHSLAPDVIDLRTGPAASTRSVPPEKSRHYESIAIARARLLDRVARRELTVAEACREAGISRARFYQLRAAYEATGIAGLRPQPPRSPRLDLRLPQHVEASICAYALLNPEHGERVITRALASPDLGGIKVSRHGVSEVLRRNGLAWRHARVSRASGLHEHPAVPAEAKWLESIYEKYRGYVYNVCRQQLGDPALAEDATQETFVRVYTHLGQFDASRSILPWLRTIASNLCIDFYRRNGRVTVKDPTDETWFDAPSSDEPLGEVLSQERRTKLESALKKLPARQRRALLLYVIEGWNYAQIAATEDISLQAVKSRLFRARRKLREAREVGLLGTVVLPVRRLSTRLNQWMHESAAAAGMVSTVAASQLVAAIIAFAMINAPSPGELFVGLSRPNDLSLAARSISTARVSNSTSTGTPHGGGSNDDTNQLAESAKDLVDPNRNARQPEDVLVNSIALSPRFASDRTMFSVGSVPCIIRCSPVLFRSSDAGATWVRLKAAGLDATTLLLPPSFPSDPRVFGMGPLGLQVSNDGGESFTPILPVAHAFVGSAAISPLFNKEDHEILIGAEWLIGYNDGTKTFLPSPHDALPGPLEPAYSPDYANDGLVIVGGTSPDPRNHSRGAVFRCSSMVCSQVVLGGLRPRIRFDPAFARSRLVYAFDEDGIYRSKDAGVSFQPLAAVSSSSGISDLAVLPGGRTLIATVNAGGQQGASGVFVSFDGGLSWRRTSLPAKRVGARTVVASSTVVIVALTRGLACSIDGGRTWSARCPRRYAST